MLKEHVYLSDQYNTVEELEKDLAWYWSGSRFDSYMHCWRRGNVQYDRKLQPKEEETIKMDAGSALHAGLATFYAYEGKQGGAVGREMSMAAMLSTLEERGGFPVLPPDDPLAHFTPGHMQIIMKNYWSWAQLHDSILPIVVELDDLDLTDVMGAKFKLTPNGKIVLGESALIMRMRVSPPWLKGGWAEYIYAGIPDLPVIMGGSVYVMDHKSSGWPLSSYWASKWRVDNTLRVYCIMIKKLLSKQDLYMRGIMLNGIFMGKQATNPKSKAKKFERFGPWKFGGDSLQEALINHAAAIETKKFYGEKLGYYPQSTGLYCGGCPAKHLCHQDPKMRPGVEVVSYKQKEHHFILEVNDAGSKQG